jgi:hypothetical protein
MVSGFANVAETLAFDNRFSFCENISMAIIVLLQMGADYGP